MSGDRSLPELLRDLESPLDDVRKRAFEALVEHPSLLKIRGIRKIALSDPDVELRFKARQFLERVERGLATSVQGAASSPVSEFLGDVLNALNKGSAQDRIRLVARLALRPEPEVASLLTSLLEIEKDPLVLAQLIPAVATAGGASRAPSLARFLTHGDPRLRATAIEALQLFDDDRIVALIIPALQDAHHRVQAAAAVALRSRRPVEVLAAIDRLLASGLELERRSALYVLGFFPPEAAVERLSACLSDPRPAVREMAERALRAHAGRGSEGAVRALAGSPPAAAAPAPAPQPAQLDSADPRDRQRAAADLVHGGRESRPAVLGAIALEQHPVVQATLISVLGHVGRSADAKVLSGYLGSADPRVRANAIESLGRLLGADAASYLVPFLADANNRARANAIVALARASSVDAMPALASMARSPHGRVRASAIWAAAQIGTPPCLALLTELAASPDSDTAGRARRALAVLGAPVPFAGEATTTPAPQAPAPSAVDSFGDAVHRWRFDLDSPDPRERIAALDCMPQAFDAGDLEAVWPLLADDDARVRHAARRTARARLAARAPAGAARPWTPAHETGLFAGLAEGRFLHELARMVCDAPPDRIAAAMEERLPLETDSVLRASLISALGLIGPDGIAGRLARWLADPDPRVRANTVDAILLAGSPAELESVLPLVADGEPRVRAAATRACAALGEVPIASFVRGMLASGNASERAAGLHVLESVDLAPARSILLDHLRCECETALLERTAALYARLARVAGETPDTMPEGVAGAARLAIQRAFERCTPGASGAAVAPPEPDDDLGSLSIEELRARLASTADAFALVRLLRRCRVLAAGSVDGAVEPLIHHRDPRIRSEAARFFADTQHPARADVFEDLLRDDDREVARYAVEQLNACEPERCRRLLEEALRSGALRFRARGLELIETLATARALDGGAVAALALASLEVQSHPSLVEIQVRLLEENASASVLERLDALLASSPAGNRTLLVEIARVVGTRLGIAEGLLKARYPGGRGTRTVPVPAPVPAARSPGMVLGGAALVVGLVLYWAPLSMRSAPGYAPAPTRVEPPKRPISRSPAGPRGSAAARRVPSFDDVLAASRVNRRTPGTAEVRERVVRALAAKGVHDEEMIEVVALSRSDHEHLAELRDAWNAERSGDARKGIVALQASLARTPPRHLTARVALLEGLERLSRSAGLVEDSLSYRARMLEVGQDFRRVTLRAFKAASPAGLEELERDLDARTRLEGAAREALAEAGKRSN